MRDPPLPDESNPYLQKSPSTMVCVGFPLPKTTPPENSLAGGGIVGLRLLTTCIILMCGMLSLPFVLGYIYQNKAKKKIQLDYILTKNERNSIVFKTRHKYYITNSQIFIQKWHETDIPE